jgi:photosystem II stability/assembly factor-like uncharacterized protein
MAADGAGKWVVGQEDNLYYSSDDGANWSRVHSFTNTYTITGLAFTNNSLALSYERSTDSTKTYIRSAAVSDLTTWSSEAGGGALPNNDSGANLHRTTIAADRNGRIAVLPFRRQVIGYADINGTTTPANFGTVNLSSAMPASELLTDVATDGVTWLAVGQDGVLFESTDSAETWTLIASDIYDSTHDIMNITANVYLPLK